MMSDDLDKTQVLDEITKCDAATVDVDTLEVEVFDPGILTGVIRRRELEIIRETIAASNSHLVLDVGCGSGWLSKYLLKQGYKVVGIDISRGLLECAKKSLGKAEFVTCDIHSLPFKAQAFDFVIGMGILHHLKALAISQVREVGSSELLFMEPNKLDFISHVGRELFPTEMHTIGETPFIPSHLQTSFEKRGIRVISMKCILSIAFPIARFLQILRARPPNILIRLIWFFERLSEKIPLLNKVSSTIVIHGVVTKIQTDT